MNNTLILKFILFNEDKEYYEFLSVEEVAKFLNTSETDVILVGEDKLNGYYIEPEYDSIVQYSFHAPIKVWNNLQEMCKALEVHPVTVERSLKTHCLSRIHFKWFSETKGRIFRP